MRDPPAQPRLSPAPRSRRVRCGYRMSGEYTGKCSRLAPETAAQKMMSMSAPHNTTTRFSDRVENYIRYRPGYPPSVLAGLAEEFGLRRDHAIADVGSGTGISAEVFLRYGCMVYGVEPNHDMRAAAERLLAGYPRFSSINGTAERTTLPDASVDWIVAAQAFHWFDVPRARDEFRRILRPGGRVALLWNERREDTPFLAAYEALIREFATDYAQVRHENARSDGRIEQFYGSKPAERTFENEQRFDFDGLAGRLLSSSYVPNRGTPRCDAMLAALRRLFDEHANGRRVSVLYTTRMFVAPLSQDA